MYHKCLSLVLGLLLAVGANAANVPPDVIELKASVGPVSFAHKEHLARVGGQCNTCHHMHKGSGPVQSCHTCHQQKPMGPIPESQKAFHTTCQKCHTGKEKADPKDPMGQCKFCHKMP